jgi:predicted lipoprotein with Yx(FWY)xxD motif
MTKRMRAGLAAVLVTAMTIGCGDAQSDDKDSTSLSTASAPSVGAYLTDAKGRAVYMFVLDDRNMSRCADACAVAWPPLPAVTVAKRAEGGWPASLIGMITRTDDRRQTTYNGMPLYYYEDDERPGDIKGQGKNEFGGLWYLVSPSGAAIKLAVHSSTATR